MAKIDKRSAEREANIAEAISKTEDFFEANKKRILYGFLALAALVAIILGWYYLIKVPNKKEAINQLFTAERYFRTDSFNIALNGDGNTLGFKQIIDKYGSNTPESAYFNAGVCELRLGNNEQAIKYLNKYSSKDNIMAARAKALIGDALVNKGDIKQAVPYFEEAAKKSNNVLSAGYLFKAALCYEELEQPKQALDIYNKVKDLYPDAPEASEIDKYIARIEAQMAN